MATRNRAARLEALLESLRRQTIGSDRFEVVVADDHSTDGTGAVLEHAPPELSLKVVRMRERGGPARSRNAGWRAARAPLVAFTDDDCEATPTWLEAGVRSCEARPGAFVQGRTEPNPRERDSWGPFARTLDIRHASPWFETCNMFYPRRLLERLGGFDESFPVPGGEDTDLGWRSLEAGAESGFARDAVVRHAVEDLGPRGQLRVALRWADAMGMFRHPGLRRSTLIGGVFWKWSHALLLAALVGVALSARARPALGLALPYVRLLWRRARQPGAGLPLAAYFALHDLLETYAAVSGSLRRGLLVV